MNKVAQLREFIFRSQNELQSKIKNSFNHKELIHYYPPNVNNLKLSKQDPALKELKLRDEWIDKKRDKEISLEARRKKVRVSVLFGQLKPSAEEAKGGKKKKRK